MDLEINMAFMSLTPSSLMMSPCFPKNSLASDWCLASRHQEKPAASHLLVQWSFLPERNDPMTEESLV